MKDNEFLIKLWNHIDMLDVVASPTEREVIGDVETHENALIKSLDDKQKVLFDRYDASMSELNYIYRQDAFIKGVKFATAYLLEATNDLYR